VIVHFVFILLELLIVTVQPFFLLKIHSHFYPFYSFSLKDRFDRCFIWTDLRVTFTMSGMFGAHIMFL
jgi:hypothetical protein